MRVFVPLPFRTLTSSVASPGDDGITPSGLWLPGAPVISARVVTDLSHRTGNIEVVPAVQWANNAVSPDATPTLLGSFTAATGKAFPSAFTALNSGTPSSLNRQLLRLGWVTRNTSGTALGSIDASGMVEFEIADYYARLHHAWTPFATNSTSAVFVPTGQWNPTKSNMQIRGTIESRGGMNHLTLQLAYQLANDTQNPDAAVGFGASVTTETFTFPTAWATPTVAGKQFIRTGWLVKSTALGLGVGAAAAELDVIIP